MLKVSISKYDVVVEVNTENGDKPSNKYWKYTGNMCVHSVTPLCLQ